MDKMEGRGKTRKEDRQESANLYCSRGWRRRHKRNQSPHFLTRHEEVKATKRAHSFDFF